jgi:SpoVK/Ycf46/Vps4 family AAA+-type ATPase
MDEADVFMAKRDQDLERSAIVGVFLRLLDYYPGLFFLTSNRVDVIDPAFKSRITLSLAYPSLGREARLRVWETMLRMAGLTVSDGIDGIPDLDLNGRQIRNLVRLVRVLYPDGMVSSGQVKQVCEFACR